MFQRSFLSRCLPLVSMLRWRGRGEHKGFLPRPPSLPEDLLASSTRQACTGTTSSFIFFFLRFFQTFTSCFLCGGKRSFSSYSPVLSREKLDRGLFLFLIPKRKKNINISLGDQSAVREWIVFEGKRKKEIKYVRDRGFSERVRRVSSLCHRTRFKGTQAKRKACVYRRNEDRVSDYLYDTSLFLDANENQRH